MTQPWGLPYAALAQQMPLAGDWLNQANRLAAARQLMVQANQPLQFVPASKISAVNFEQHIYSTGQIPSRATPLFAAHDCLHDWFHAQVWLQFPRSKTQLNRLHIESLAAVTALTQSNRSAQRDRLTLFDENGVLLVVSAAPGLTSNAVQNALEQHDWPTLFVQWREHWGRSIVPLCFGHGLLQRLQAPFKAITGKAMVVAMDQAAAGNIDLAAVDLTLSQQVSRLLKHKPLPLPVMGIPFWHSANSDPLFYTDTTVFRKAS